MLSQIYIVEDNDIMRSMLVEFVNDAPGMAVSGAASSAEEALTGLADVGCDLILIDMSLPGLSGAEFVRQILQKTPRLLCLMYSGHREAGYVDQAMDAGARGYVLKGTPHELPVAIREVLSGHTYLSAPLKK